MSASAPALQWDTHELPTSGDRAIKAAAPFGRGCIYQKRRTGTGSSEEKFGRRRESNPTTSIVWAPYRGGIAQNCATSEEKSAPSPRNPVLRGTIAQPAWTKGTMRSENGFEQPFAQGLVLSPGTAPRCAIYGPYDERALAVLIISIATVNAWQSAATAP
jgi:hypothetical protein